MVTVSRSVKFFEGQLQYVAERGYDVTMVRALARNLTVSVRTALPPTHYQ